MDPVLIVILVIIAVVVIGGILIYNLSLIHI